MSLNNDIEKLLLQIYKAKLPVMKEAEKFSCDIRLNARQMINIEAALESMAEAADGIIPDEAKNLRETQDFIRINRQTVFK